MISHYEGSNLKRQNCRKDMEASLVRERERGNRQERFVYRLPKCVTASYMTCLLTIVWCGPRHCLVLVRRHKRGWRQQLSGQRYYSGMMTAALSVTNPLSSTATVLTVEHRFIFPNHQVKKINPIKLQWFLPLLIATAYMGLVWLFIPDIESVTNWLVTDD